MKKQRSKRTGCGMGGWSLSRDIFHLLRFFHLLRWLLSPELRYFLVSNIRSSSKICRPVNVVRIFFRRGSPSGPSWRKTLLFFFNFESDADQELEAKVHLDPRFPCHNQVERTWTAWVSHSIPGKRHLLRFSILLLEERYDLV